MLITPGEYRVAEMFVGEHLGALAIELGVTPKLIEAWRRWYRRTHQAREVDSGRLSIRAAPSMALRFSAILEVM